LQAFGLLVGRLCCTTAAGADVAWLLICRLMCVAAAMALQLHCMLLPQLQVRNLLVFVSFGCCAVLLINQSLA
jgi:hypothetical protein